MSWATTYYIISCTYITFVDIYLIIHYIIIYCQASREYQEPQVRHSATYHAEKRLLPTSKPALSYVPSSSTQVKHTSFCALHMCSSPSHSILCWQKRVRLKPIKLEYQRDFTIAPISTAHPSILGYSRIPSARTLGETFHNSKGLIQKPHLLAENVPDRLSI